VLVTSDGGFFASPGLAGAKQVAVNATSAWTDDYSNLWRSLK